MRLLYVALAPSLMAMSVVPAMAQDVQFVSGIGEPVSAKIAQDRVTPVSGDIFGDTDVGSDDPRADAFGADDAAADGKSTADFNTMADRIADPDVQDDVASMIESVTGAMMQMPVGRFAEAIERARPGTVSRKMRGDATVADLAGRDSRALPRELGERSRDAMGMMSGLARAMAMMMPEFERIGRTMEDSIETARSNTRRARN